MPHTSLPLRIIIVGTTGSGKTTLAKRVSEKMDIPHIEIDALFWKPDWEESANEEFFAKAKAAVTPENWVMDGNYGRLRPITWQRATMIVWIDLPFWLNCWQIVSRTIRRVITREKLWAGNQERFFKSFFTKDSIIHWFFATYHSNKKRYIGMLATPPYPHLKMVRLSSRKAIEVWLHNL